MAVESSGGWCRSERDWGEDGGEVGWSVIESRKVEGGGEIVVMLIEKKKYNGNEGGGRR